jgi:hypothetical protein
LRHTGIKAIASVVPGGGELFGLLTSPLNRRRDDWLEDLERRLRDAERKVADFHFEDLASNEDFVSAATQATKAAMETHQKEKLEALKNAVINVALGKQPDPNRQHQFLALVDRFSEAHLVVLKVLNDPAGHLERQGKSVPFVVRGGTKLLVNNFVADAVPSLRTSSFPKERESTPFQFLELILRDLVSNRLVTVEPLNDTWAVPAFSPRQGGAPIQNMATHLGEDFLAFITESDLEKE